MTGLTDSERLGHFRRGMRKRRSDASAAMHDAKRRLPR
jgi:hypothetical protein